METANKQIIKVKAIGRGVRGDCFPVGVELTVSKGLGIHINGLRDRTVKETLLRTVTALQSLGFRLLGKEMVVDIVPVPLRGDCTGLDLPLAVALIAASGQVEIPSEVLNRTFFNGELRLDGTLSQDGWNGYEKVICTRSAIVLRPIDFVFSKENAIQASPLTGENIFGFDHLSQVVDFLTGKASRRDFAIWNTPEYQQLELNVENAKYSF